jgi:hypothetical protein
MGTIRHDRAFASMSIRTQFIVGALCMLLGPGCIWLLRRDLRSGETTWPRKYAADLHYDRYKNPLSYWFCIWVYAVGGIMASVAGFWLLIDAFRRLQQ